MRDFGKRQVKHEAVAVERLEGGSRKFVWRCPYGCWRGQTLPSDGCPNCGVGVVSVDAVRAAREMRRIDPRGGWTSAKIRAAEARARAKGE